MRIRFPRRLANLALAAAIACPIAASFNANAQEPPATPSATQQAPVSATALNGALNDDSLKALLIGLGYEPAELRTTSGTPVNELNFVEDDFRFIFQIYLSPNQRQVITSARLMPLPGESDASAPQVIRLLEENHALAPLAFSVDKHTRYVHLNLLVANSELSPSRMREVLATFKTILRRTEPLWDTNRWSTQPAPQQPVAAQPVAQNAAQQNTAPQQNAAPVQSAAQQNATPQNTPAPSDGLKPLQGVWRVVGVNVNGVAGTPEQLRQFSHVTIAGRSLSYSVEGKGSLQVTLLNANDQEDPRAIDWQSADGTVERAIYSAEGDRLTFCVAFPQGERPRQFASENNQVVLLTLERVAACPQGPPSPTAPSLGS